MENCLLKLHRNLTPTTKKVEPEKTESDQCDILSKMLSGSVRKRKNKDWGIDNSVPVGDRD